jgi:hypothetical protein
MRNDAASRNVGTDVFPAADQAFRERRAAPCAARLDTGLFTSDAPSRRDAVPCRQFLDCARRPGPPSNACEAAVGRNMREDDLLGATAVTAGSAEDVIVQYAESVGRTGRCRHPWAQCPRLDAWHYGRLRLSRRLARARGPFERQLSARRGGRARDWL